MRYPEILKAIGGFLNDICGLAAALLSGLSAPAAAVASLRAENLFLRRQLALYEKHAVKRRRTTPSVRLSMVFLSQLFEWRHALVIVKPDTLIR